MVVPLYKGKGSHQCTDNYLEERHGGPVVQGQRLAPVH